jgi:hypothetical protein
LLIYEGVPDFSPAPNFAGRDTFLAVRFVKVLARQLTSRPVRGDDEPMRRFVAFTGVGGFSGVFITGDSPAWILASDLGPPRLWDSAQKGVYSFCPFDGREHPEGFALGTREVK